MYFNPRPRKEGDVCQDKKGKQGRYFNPRPRKEGDSSLTADKVRHFISIHALAKRATCARTHCTLANRISIHALAKRATTPVMLGVPATKNFNPRPRKEGDNRRWCRRCSRQAFQSTPSQRGRPPQRSALH